MDISDDNAQIDNKMEEYADDDRMQNISMIDMLKITFGTNELRSDNLKALQLLFSTLLQHTNLAETVIEVPNHEINTLMSRNLVGDAVKIAKDTSLSAMNQQIDELKRNVQDLRNQLNNTNSIANQGYLQNMESSKMMPDSNFDSVRTSSVSSSQSLEANGEPNDLGDPGAAASEEGGDGNEEERGGVKENHSQYTAQNNRLEFTTESDSLKTKPSSRENQIQIHAQDLPKEQLVTSKEDTHGSVEMNTVASASFMVPGDNLTLSSLKEAVLNIRQMAGVLSERADRADSRLTGAIGRLDAIDREHILRITTSEKHNEQSTSTTSNDDLEQGNITTSGVNFGDVIADLEKANNDLGGDIAEDSAGDDAEISVNSKRTRSVSEVEAKKAITNRQTVKVRAKFGRIRNDINTMLNDGATKFRLLGLDLSRFHETISTIKDRIFIDQEDSSNLQALMLAVSKLKSELEKVTLNALQIVSGNIIKSPDIIELNEICTHLSANKADKTEVENRLLEKADVELMKKKMDVKEFDDIILEVNRVTTSLVERLVQNEDEWSTMLNKIAADMTNKVTAKEYNRQKDETDKQISLVIRVVKQLEKNQQNTISTSGETTTLTKQMPIHNCIGCNRPVDVNKERGMTSPATYELPKSRTWKPYTSQKMAQIREQFKRPDARNNYGKLEQLKIVPPKKINPSSRPVVNKPVLNKKPLQFKSGNKSANSSLTHDKSGMRSGEKSIISRGGTDSKSHRKPKRKGVKVAGENSSFAASTEHSKTTKEHKKSSRKPHSNMKNKKHGTKQGASDSMIRSS